jgi:hypothetical protein
VEVADTFADRADNSRVVLAVDIRFEEDRRRESRCSGTARRRSSRFEARCVLARGDGGFRHRRCRRRVVRQGRCIFGSPFWC